MELVNDPSIKSFDRSNAVEALGYRKADADEVVPLLADLITGDKDVLVSSRDYALGESRAKSTSCSATNIQETQRAA